MTIAPVIVEDWPTALRRAFARAKIALPLDLAEFLTDRDAMMAVGLTQSLLDLCTSTADRRRVADAAARGDLLGLRAAGHGEIGQDLQTGYRAGERMSDTRSGVDWQIYLLGRYVAFRASGAPLRAMPRDIAALDSRLLALANAASASEIHSLVDGLGQIPAMRVARLAEYKAIGADLLAENRSLVSPAPGPATGPGLPRRSWEPTPEGDEPGPAPSAEEAPAI